jgi:prevent-host-death family protein
MHTVNVREARMNFSKLLSSVESGETVVITRRGKPVAKFEMIESTESISSFPDRRSFRSELPPCTSSTHELIRDIRDERW